MRIALDCRAVTAPKSGDRTYALNLVRALARVDQDYEYLLYTAEPTTLTDLRAPNFEPVVLTGSPGWAWTALHFPRDLARRGADLAHVQYSIPPSSPRPVVTTIHHVAFRRFPELYSVRRRLLLGWLVSLAVEHSAAVLTGSETTRRDLIEFYDARPEQVHVIPYAADPSFRPMDPDEARQAVRRRLRVPSPYVLALGSDAPRKNLPRLVRAYNRIAASVPHRLVLVGKESAACEGLQSAAAESPPGKQPFFTGYVADADLSALYAGADLFCYPSLYEGFAFPPLEAMACGTPVLTGSSPPVAEVVGGAAALADPRDERALAAALRDLLEDPTRRRNLSAAGLCRAREFDWDRTARETLAVYSLAES